jgi:predicted transposase/invertase (TIGR01784 family)
MDKFYAMTRDTVFKLMFVNHPQLLKNLVAEFLNLKLDDITEFYITNPELYPEELGKKFSRLDIHMIVNGQRVDLEVQVEDEGNYPERSLYYWAKDFSAGLNESEDYSALPKTIVISILGFNMFPDPKKFYHEFQCLEVSTHIPLTDKQVLYYYELKKLPPLSDADNVRDLWLKLFSAKTREEIDEIAQMGVPIMSDAIQTYFKVTKSDELANLERMRVKRGHDEAQALKTAEQRGEARANKIWQKKHNALQKEQQSLQKKQQALQKEQQALQKEQQALQKEQQVLQNAVADKDTRIAELEALLQAQADRGN